MTIFIEESTGQQVSKSEAAMRGISLCDDGGFGFQPIVETPRPGPGYTRGPNELIGGQWRMTWVAPGLEALKAEKLSALSAEYQRRVQSYPHDFGAPHGVQYLQLRDVTDQSNWNTLQAKAMREHAKGNGDEYVLAFRTEANTTVPATANQVLVVLDSMAAFGGQMKACYWTLKDAINAAEDHAALEEIDITTGWPE